MVSTLCAVPAKSNKSMQVMFDAPLNFADAKTGGASHT